MVPDLPYMSKHVPVDTVPDNVDESSGDEGLGVIYD